MSSFLDRIPPRWRKIGVVHVFAATLIIGSLRYVQSQHAARTEATMAEIKARRREERQQQREADQAEDEQREAARSKK